MPFIISSMTGGYAKAERINRQLAEVCAHKKIALGVGSQRQALEDARYHRSFSVVREAAPDIPIFGNIGAAEVARLKDASPILRMIDLIQCRWICGSSQSIAGIASAGGQYKFPWCACRH